MSDSFFNPEKCIVFDLETYPNRWCVGFHGLDHLGDLTTKIVESKTELKRMLDWFAKQGRTLCGFNSAKFDGPLIQGILKGIDPYAPAQTIIKEDRLPPALSRLPEFPCDHIDISARLRRGGTFPGLKTVAANLGLRVLRELPFPPGSILSDEQWEAVKEYNGFDLLDTWALLERLAPELEALVALSRDQGQDLRSVSTPQVVEKVFSAAYRKQHSRDPARIDPPHEVRYRPVQGVVRPRTWDAADWFDRIVNEPIPMVARGERRKPSVPAAKFKIGNIELSVGAGGLHSVDSPGVYYATRRHRLLSVDVASFYPSLIATKGISPAGYGDTGRDTYRSLLERRLAVKKTARAHVDPDLQAALNVQADGLKLVLNSFVGKTADPYSTLYDPGAFLTVTLSGQLMLIDLVERLTDAKVRVISANTDGLFLRVPREHRGWRAILKKWEADTGMKLDVEPLKRLAILASNQFATRDAEDKLKRKGGELRGALDWSHAPNHLVMNDAIVQALLFDVPPERTIFDCDDLIRFCSVTKRSSKATAMVLVDGDTTTELPRVTRWYRAKESSKRIETRFEGGGHTTPAGAQSVSICQDLPESGLPDDIDWAWYLGQARRKIQKVPGYRHRSRRRLRGHTAAVEVLDAGLLPVPKYSKRQPTGSDAKHPTLLWDWSSYPTVGCFTGPMVHTLVVDVDEEGKFKKFVDWGNAPLLGDRWETLAGCLVSFHGDATADRVRAGNARGKLIFKFAGGPDHPLCRAGAKWKKTRGVEVFYGNGMPSILGQYGDNGDHYLLDGTLGPTPEWLIESLIPRPPKAGARKKGASPMTLEAQRDALKDLPAHLAEFCPELGNPAVGWRRKEQADGREILIGRCPFEHDSGESDDGDLSVGYHEDGPWIRCMHGSCAQIRAVNRRLKEEHQRSQPRKSRTRKSGTPRQESPPLSDDGVGKVWEGDPATPEKTGDSEPSPAVQVTEDTPAPPSGNVKVVPVTPSQRSADGGETQAQMLLRIAAAASLFHSEEGRTYASVPIRGHVETHEIRSSGFRRWLTHSFFLEQGRPPAREGMQGALGVIEAKASFEGQCENVHVRVAPHGDSAIYIDLGDASWRAVEIRPDGWNVADNGPVRFRRPAGLRELPIPQRGGSADALKPFVNLREDEFVLLWVWLTAALRPAGPYPILALIGEQGSAKSTLARLARRLVDPHVSPLRGDPREPRDLMIAACNSWVVAIDNVSSIRPWLSDSLCRLATGGGYATRTLYSNDEETFLDAQRPVILNGIEDFVTRGDLIDRCLFLHLPAILEKKRRIEAEFWRELEVEYPSILGALLDAVAGGLDRFSEVRLPTLPRMADFALWGEAVGLAMGWTPGRFLSVYSENRKSANEMVLEDSPVAGAVRKLVSGGKWTGTSTELMDALAVIVGEKLVASERWPKSPRGMSGVIRRLATQLRMVGVEVTSERATGGSRSRTFVIESTGNQPSQPSRTACAPDETRDGRDEQPTSTVPQPSRPSPGKQPRGTVGTVGTVESPHFLTTQTTRRSERSHAKPRPAGAVDGGSRLSIPHG